MSVISNDSQKKQATTEIVREGCATHGTISSSDSDDSILRYNATNNPDFEGLEVQDYREDTVTVKDYVENVFSNPKKKSIRYVKSLFPILNWITHYPFMPEWIYSDFVAGLTVAIVLVPQGMSYAQLATLSPEYGLYSSFIGLLIYSIFATSKDVSIGPVAVMSMEVGKIITRVHEKTGDTYSGPEIATTLALICGGVTLGIGLLRIGFIVELIPLPAVLAFMGGSAFSIIVGQVPGLLGYNKHVNTRGAAYKVVIDTLTNLHRTKVDAAFGLVCLFILYAWRYLTSRLYKSHPRNRIYFYLQHIRAAVVIIFATLISYLIIRHYPKSKKTPYSIIGTIHSGLEDVTMFHPPSGLAKDLASEIPVATIVLVLEHISIAKSFGRINDYKINPNQEFIAIGVTNLIGTFFHSYPATGSFSRTALKSKCGVKTPFAGVFGGACVLLSIYCFTSAFYYIPKAALCAIIIHAVSDLIPSYKVTWSLFKVSPVDGLIFIVGILLTVFTAIENGIYFAMAAAVAQVLWKLCITNGTFLGRAKVIETVNPVIHHKGDNNTNKKYEDSQLIYHYEWVPIPGKEQNPSSIHTRYVNNKLRILPPPPGVIVYRLSESFIYPNCSRQADQILDEVKRATKDGRTHKSITWNHPGPLIVRNPFSGVTAAVRKVGRKFKGAEDTEDQQDSSISEKEKSSASDGDKRPSLRVLHLDFSQVVSVDTTSIQALIDLKKAVQTYSNAEFEIHFSGIINPWVIRALINSGFGGEDYTTGITSDEHTSNSNNNGDADNSPDGDGVDTDDPMSIISIDNRPQATSTKTTYVDAGLDDGELRALYDSRHPHFHFRIPSYSQFD